SPALVQTCASGVPPTRRSIRCSWKYSSSCSSLTGLAGAKISPSSSIVSKALSFPPRRHPPHLNGPPETANDAGPSLSSPQGHLLMPRNKIALIGSGQIGGTLAH